MKKGRYSRYNWQAVDWRLQNCVIARLLGCCERAVGIRRRMMGKRRAIAHHAHPPWREAVRWRNRRFKWEIVNWRASNSTIAKKLGCSRESVRKWRKRRLKLPRGWWARGQVRRG